MEECDINPIIERYLNSKNVDYGLLITGCWGTGKTYYVKNNLIEKYNPENKQKKRLVYLSLMDITDANQMSSSISYRCLLKDNNSLENVGKATNSIICSLKPRKAEIISSVFKEVGSFVIEEWVNNKKDDYLLVFDDLERIDNELLDKAIGVINAKYISNGFHVIFIANEDKFGDNSKFKEYKEKHIRYSLDFRPSFKEIYGSIRDSYKDKSFCDVSYSFIEGCFKSNYSDKNLRTLMYAFDCYNDIYNKAIDGINKEFLFFNIYVRAILYKNNIADKESITKELKANEIASDYDLYSTMIEQEHIVYNTPYIVTLEHIHKYIFTGILDRFGIDSELQSIFVQKSEYVKALYTLYANRSSLKYSEIEHYLDLVYEGLESDQFDPAQYINAINVFYYCKYNKNYDLDSLVDILIGYANRRDDYSRWKELISYQVESTNGSLDNGDASSFFKIQKRISDALLAIIDKRTKEDNKKLFEKLLSDNTQIDCDSFNQKLIDKRFEFIEYLSKDADLDLILLKSESYVLQNLIHFFFCNKDAFRTKDGTRSITAISNKINEVLKNRESLDSLRAANIEELAEVIKCIEESK